MLPRVALEYGTSGAVDRVRCRFVGIVRLEGFVSVHIFFLIILAVVRSRSSFRPDDLCTCPFILARTSRPKLRNLPLPSSFRPHAS